VLSVRYQNSIHFFSLVFASVSLSLLLPLELMAALVREPIQDPSNPLFLHHSDGPDLVLISQPLYHNNYTTWSRAMFVALKVKNKVAFVDGSLPKPPPTDATFAAWSRANSVVISWLFNSVSKEIINSILFATTAQEIWEDLKIRFSRNNRPHIFQLRRQLVSTQQGTDSVSTYYTKIKCIREELASYRPEFHCTCGGLQQLQDQTDTEYVMCFLMGLNESFSNIRGQILLSDPLPSIDHVLSILLQEEAQREIIPPSSYAPYSLVFSVIR